MYDNDGRFPDGSPIEVPYPRSKQEEQGERSKWPWLPGALITVLVYWSPVTFRV